MGELKNKQHYIFQAYLKAWQNEDKKIWVYKKNDKKIFPASTRDVLNKRRLYQLRNMNSDEKNFFELCMEVFKLNDESKAEMRNHIAAYLLPFSNQKLVDAIKRINPIPKDHELTPEIQNHFDELDRANEEAIVNTEEDFYSDYESDGEGWIRKILMQDLDFYYPPKIESEEMVPSEKYAERDDFINFLCIQYFRTCEMRDTMVKNISNMLKLAESEESLDVNSQNINPENLLPHMIWILQSNCAAALIHRNAHMTVLINDTALPFITSDQPIINKESASDNDSPKEFVLYYPLSPTVAITVNDRNRCKTKHIDKKSIVDDYNRKIIEHSYEYLVANKESVLQGIIEMDL